VTRLILASGSPRRRELLGSIVTAFEVMPADIEEPLGDDAIADARVLALGKAHAVADANADAVVIGSDTVVFDERGSLGKPADHDEGITMLRSLRGRTHQVVTGIAVVGPDIELVDHVVSEVTIAALPDERIEAYVASGRTFDKAGGYAIQDDEFSPVERLAGCYCNVMGLPLWRLKKHFDAADIDCSAPNLIQCESCPDANSAR
jgi:septum formation protein